MPTAQTHPLADNDRRCGECIVGTDQPDRYEHDTCRLCAPASRDSSQCLCEGCRARHDAAQMSVEQATALLQTRKAQRLTSQANNSSILALQMRLTRTARRTRAHWSSRRWSAAADITFPFTASRCGFQRRCTRRRCRRTTSARHHHHSIQHDSRMRGAHQCEHCPCYGSGCVLRWSHSSAAVLPSDCRYGPTRARHVAWYASSHCRSAALSSPTTISCCWIGTSVTGRSARYFAPP